MKESGSYENDFSEFALQQNTLELNTKNDKTRKNLTLGIKQLSSIAGNDNPSFQMSTLGLFTDVPTFSKKTLRVIMFHF